MRISVGAFILKANIVKAGIDYKQAYTLQFVNKGVGVDLRPKI